MMKRIFDILMALMATLFLLPVIIIISLLIKLTSKGPILHWSERVGKNNQTFQMPKFRTMLQNTPPLATRLMENPYEYLTQMGSFLRRTSLDEIPQLWSILRGDMSFVGPRPLIIQEEDFLTLRTQEGIHCCVPGLTGWAQINGRDCVTLEEKIALEKEYAERQTFLFDLYILLKTVPKVFCKQGISH